jgi:hypothetical protein
MLEYGYGSLPAGSRCLRSPLATPCAEKLPGLFGAYVDALATLLITLSHKGAMFAASEGRSMIVGAFALAAYSWVVCVLLKKFVLPSWTATMAALVVWFVAALGVSAALFRLS